MFVPLPNCEPLLDPFIREKKKKKSIFLKTARVTFFFFNSLLYTIPQPELALSLTFTVRRFSQEHRWSQDLLPQHWGIQFLVR